MKKETKIGIYLTVIVHLVALIIILSIQISSLIKRESSFRFRFQSTGTMGGRTAQGTNADGNQ